MTIAASHVQDRPVVRLQAGRARRVRAGHPWVFSNEIEMTPEVKALEPGTVIAVADQGGDVLGAATFNPHTLIAARLLSANGMEEINADFLGRRIATAAAWRDRLFPQPFYRLVHAEADGLPGLVIDRYGDVLACQVNTAGMERLQPDLLAALEHELSPRAVVLCNDSAARELEGLPVYRRVAVGDVAGAVELVENGAHFLADLLGGQKTGWFFDQRDNRAFVAGLARGRRVLDLYTYAGGFAVQAALAGAAEVVAVDSAAPALAMAAKAAELNAVADRCRFVRAQAFGEMERLARDGERFGVVVADPPAFVKTRKSVATGAKGYRKMTRLAAALVEPGGFLLVASCSHHMTAERFAEEVARGLHQAGRQGRIIRQAGAAPDHPVHPMLPESAYLKALVLHLD